MAEMSNNQTVREEIITEQGEEIEKLRERLNYWVAAQSYQVTRSTQLKNVMIKVANQLAVSTCVQMTHRERNEMARDIVRQVFDELSRPTVANDDIPF